MSNIAWESEGKNLYISRVRGGYELIANVRSGANYIGVFVGYSPKIESLIRTGTKLDRYPANLQRVYGQ